jgi:hypothetical protein
LEEEKPDFTNQLKKVAIKEMESAIGAAITNLVNHPKLKFICTINNIRYQGSDDANLTLEIKREFHIKVSS